MSVYQFLRDISINHKEPNADPVEDHQEDPELFEEFSLKVYFPIFIIATCLSFVIYWLFFRKSVEKQNSIIFHFAFHLQNYFNNPVIQNVHFYHGDQVVPDTD